MLFDIHSLLEIYDFAIFIISYMYIIIIIIILITITVRDNVVVSLKNLEKRNDSHIHKCFFFLSCIFSNYTIIFYVHISIFFFTHLHIKNMFRTQYRVSTIILLILHYRS